MSLKCLLLYKQINIFLRRNTGKSVLPEFFMMYTRILYINVSREEFSPVYVLPGNLLSLSLSQCTDMESRKSMKKSVKYFPGDFLEKYIQSFLECLNFRVTCILRNCVKGQWHEIRSETSGQCRYSGLLINCSPVVTVIQTQYKILPFVAYTTTLR